MSEWKDWKPGDKLVCVDAGVPMLENPEGEMPVIGRVYTLAMVHIVPAGRMVKCGSAIWMTDVDLPAIAVSELPGTGWITPKVFKRIEERPEHRGMAILRDIAHGIRLPEHASEDQALHMLRASRSLAWKRGNAWLGQEPKVTYLSAEECYRRWGRPKPAGE